MKKLWYSFIFGIVFTLCSCNTGDVSSYSNDSSNQSLWGEVNYVWAEDKTSLTATRALLNDESISETETVNVNRSIKVAPTCLEKGIYLYTSEEFINKAFSVQTCESPIEATGHHLGYYAIDETKHYHGCDQCDYVINEEYHTWDDGVILTYAYIEHDEIVKGEKRVTCTVCNYQRIVKHSVTELEV